MKTIHLTTLFSFIVLSTSVLAQTIVIQCKQIIDGKSDKPTGNTVLVIKGQQIAAIGGKEVIPAGSTTINLPNHTIMPGMIDLHLHPLADGDDNYQIKHLENSSAAKALTCLKNLQAVLHEGWTAVRVPGDIDVGYAHLDVRNAINEGTFVGPHVYGAGHWISNTGGGGDLNFFSYEQDGVKVDGLIVDGPDEMRKAVRKEIKYGSDWIKLLVSGAYMTAGDNPRNVHFSKEELGIAVEEATKRDVPVMAHAHSAEAIKMSVLAGARTIEHGTFLDDEGIALLKQHGTYLVPTRSINTWMLEKHPDSKEHAKAVSIMKSNHIQTEAMLGKAIKAGVKVVVGTDLTGNQADYHVTEFVELVKAGMSNMQAIKAGTSLAAEALGKEKEFGTLEVGKFADLIATEGDPSVDINALKKVKFVMIGGKIARNDMDLTSPRVNQYTK